ncbi:MAG TPA: outer membrane lipoprotein-sorting protein [Candidatus Aquilonibacter sp.]
MISPTPTPTALPSAPAIVQRAYQRLRSYGTPPYVVYITNEDGDHHRIAFRASDEKMNDVEYNPKRTSLPPANVYTAFVGPLSITVHEAVVKTTSSPQAATTMPQATVAPQGQTDLMSDLKTIAIVSANARPIYKMTVHDVETVNGNQTYKIELMPTTDPTRYTLRDLWIDTSTYDVRRADYVTRDFNVPDATVYLTVEFEPVGPYWIAAHWIAIYHFLGATPPVYRELRIEKMRFPDTLPDWLFDQQGYELHSLAGDADPLAHLFDESPAP